MEGKPFAANANRVFQDIEPLEEWVREQASDAFLVHLSGLLLMNFIVILIFFYLLLLFFQNQDVGQCRILPCFLHLGRLHFIANYLVLYGARFTC